MHVRIDAGSGHGITHHHRRIASMTRPLLAAIALAAIPLSPASATQACGTQIWDAGSGFSAESWLDPGISGWACMWTDIGGYTPFSCWWNLSKYGFVDRIGRYYLNKTIDNSNAAATAWHSHGTAQTISGSISCGMYGWSFSPKIEWYIVENWWGTKINVSSYCTYKGTISANGGVYDIYYTSKVSWGDFGQWWSIRQSQRSSGNVDYVKHMKRWRQLGAGNSTLNQVSWYVEPSSYPTAGKIDFYSFTIDTP